jgi:uncharacterized protein YndB with AHSA1/START domain
MKAVVEHEVEINRSAEDVFDYCSDPSTEPQWNPQMNSCEKLTDGPLGVGARYRIVIKGKPMIVECIRFGRPKTWSTRSESPLMKAGLDGRVVPTSHGARVSMRMWIEPRGLAGLAAPLIRLLLKPAWRRDLANIKCILDSPHRAQKPGPAANRR